MTLHTETVTPAMLSIASRLRTTLDPSWYVAGGTALALHIGHRASIDLDYFTNSAFDVEIMRVRLQNIFTDGKLSFDYEAKNTLWCTIDGVKVSFITRKNSCIESPQVFDQFVLASVPDITVMKLLAVCSREEYKDYFDLACISRETDIRSWIAWWNQVYGEQDVTSWLVALGSVDRIPEIPLVVQDTYDAPPVVSTIAKVLVELTEYIQKTDAYA